MGGSIARGGVAASWGEDEGKGGGLRAKEESQEQKARAKTSKT
jgi:hypothetical protein